MLGLGKMASELHIHNGDTQPWPYLDVMPKMYVCYGSFLKFI